MYYNDPMRKRWDHPASRAARFYLAAFLLACAIAAVNARADLFAAEPPAPAHSGESQFRRSFGVGFANIGFLMRKGFKNNYSAEVHGLFGEANAHSDDVSAVVIGTRGYRHFRANRRAQPYVGLEGAYVMAETRVQDSDGFALGGFLGIEYYLLSRLSLGFDLGPYYVRIKEKALGTSGGGVDFVLSTYLNFYIF